MYVFKLYVYFFANAFLPRLIFVDGITTIGGAVGYHVTWPCDFVLVENMTTHLTYILYKSITIYSNYRFFCQADEVECDEFDECTLKEFGNLLGSVMKGNHISQMDTRIFERELQFHIAKDEIMDVCHEKNMLNANCIIAYIRCVIFFDELFDYSFQMCIWTNIYDSFQISI